MRLAINLLHHHTACVICLDQDASLVTGSVMLVADGFVNGMAERYRLLNSLYPNDFDFEVSALIPVE